MPTYAGYLMTPEAQREWLRENDPKRLERPYASAMQPVLDRLRKVKLVGKFKPHIVVLPFEPQNPNAPLEERASFMLARVVCRGDRPVWLPPRVAPGVNDIHAGEILRRCKINVSDWVVIFQPPEDPLRSHYVTPPQSSS